MHQQQVLSLQAWKLQDHSSFQRKRIKLFCATQQKTQTEKESGGVKVDAQGPRDTLSSQEISFLSSCEDKKSLQHCWP